MGLLREGCAAVQDLRPARGHFESIGVNLVKSSAEPVGRRCGRRRIGVGMVLALGMLLGAHAPMAVAATPMAVVADNGSYGPRWVEKPRLWRIYPNNAALCCGVTLRSVSWRSWTARNAYATAKTRVKTYDPWTRVRVRVYGRSAIYHEGDPSIVDGTPMDRTIYRYKYVAVTFPNGHVARWTLDFPETG